jgi:transcriptional regulator with XRE-family HTH domain
MKVEIGKSTRRIREAKGLSQRAAAAALGISAVHLCNIENGNALPSTDLIAHIRQLWGVDVYMLAWCLYGDVNALPGPVREAAMRLAKAWRIQLGIDDPAPDGGRNAELEACRASDN